MCHLCQLEVKEMDIRDTDLQMLPYTWMKWRCIFPGCKCGVKVKDYGIPPLYFWPVRICRNKKGHIRRGGWFNIANHCYCCSRHWRLYEKKQIEAPKRNPQICMSKITKIK